MDAAGQKIKAHAKISKEEVLHVAKLARLKLSEAEVDAYRKDLDSILEYVDTLGKLDTDEIEPMSHVMGKKNVWRDDNPAGIKETEPLLDNAPVREGNYFKVPKIPAG